MKLALLGDPVAQSRSPAIHSAALEAVGISGSYTARRVDEAGIARAVGEVRRGRLDGANVTMPHKFLAARLADRLEGPAHRAEATNTLVRRGSRVAGHNTDVGGVRLAWEWAELPEEGPALVLGSGGAAAAALLALEGRPLSISARRPEAAAALLGRLGVVAQQVEWGRPKEAAVVVNATPLGMNGEALPEPVLTAAAGLLDMPYGSSETPAVVAGRRLGFPVADGLEVLVAQAALAFELWTGRPAPLDVMREAARPTADG
ncbi:MAG: shikimate dehydrogenase family protein [Acidimicrobiia bacterium]